jgi:hypothetical protein
LEVVRNFYHIQELSQAHILYDQLVYALIFWTGSGGCGVMESEKLQSCTTLIRKMLISLMLQPRDHFIHPLITLPEEFICAVLVAWSIWISSLSLKHKDDTLQGKMKFWIKIQKSKGIWT